MKTTFTFECDTQETVAQCNVINNGLKVINNRFAVHNADSRRVHTTNFLNNFLNAMVENKDTIESIVSMLVPDARPIVHKYLVIAEKINKGELPEVESEESEDKGEDKEDKTETEEPQPEETKE